MSKLKLNITMSLDGFVAGPNQSPEHPLGIGGEHLHGWLYPLKAFRGGHGAEGGEINASTPFAEEILGGAGATIMGRNMFGGGPGPWDNDSWKGWWGDDPPFHHPVFVLTHHAREPLKMAGGTTFHFVTDGIESALEQARAAADDKDVSLGGGASVAQQYLAGGLLDELVVSVVPILLGGEHDSSRASATPRPNSSRSRQSAHRASLTSGTRARAERCEHLAGYPMRALTSM